MKRFAGRLVAVLLVTMMVVGMLSGAAFADEKKHVAMIPPAMTSPWYSAAINGAQEAADELGYELVTMAPPSENDYDGQVRIVEDLITGGIDGLMISAINAEAIVKAVKQANDAGIPVVIYNSLTELEGCEIYCYVGYEEYAGAMSMGDYLAEISGGEARIAILDGLPGDHTTYRKGGFSEACGKHEKMEIVAIEAADWDREKAMNVTTNILTADPTINAFFAESDEMALGAAQAVKAAGLTGKVWILSIDGNPNAVTAVKNGMITATFRSNPEGTGAIAMQQLDKAINGVPSEALKQVVTGQIVDISNAEQFPAE